MYFCHSIMFAAVRLAVMMAKLTFAVTQPRRFVHQRETNPFRRCLVHEKVASIRKRIRIVSNDFDPLLLCFAQCC